MFRSVVKEQLKVPARVDYLGELRDFVTKVGKRHGFSERVVNAFKLSIDEAATNIIKHAYRDWDGDITIRAIVKKTSMTIVLVEQSTRRALEVADAVTVLESGKQVWQGTAKEARDSSAMIDALLGLGQAAS